MATNERGKERKKKNSKLPQSQSSNVTYSDVNYFWVVVFDWSLNQPNPFQVVVKEVIGEDEIPLSWYKKKLTPTRRHQKRTLKAFKNKKVSIFCKIEKGKFQNIFYLINLLPYVLTI